MSLDTYENLKLEIADWSHRDDMDLKIDTFIDLAEVEMFSNAAEPLQVRGGETLVAFSTSITTRFVALPTGFQSFRKVRIQIANGESIKLKYRTPERLNILSSAGLPLFFTVTDQVEFNRISDQVYAGEFQYYQEFTPLSATNTSNFVLTNFPNIYLYGALWKLMIHVEQYQKAAEYKQQFLELISGANKLDWLGRYGPAPRMIVDGPTP